MRLAMLLRFAGLAPGDIFNSFTAVLVFLLALSITYLVGTRPRPNPDSRLWETVMWVIVVLWILVTLILKLLGLTD